MTRTRIEAESGSASLVYTGAGWTTAADANASGGSYRASAVNGNSVAITVPNTPAGINYCLLGNVQGTYGGTPTITKNGAALPASFPASWSMANFTTNTAAANFWYQSTTYPPIPCTAGDVITFMVAGGGANLDYVEFYSPSAPVAGRITPFGHSIVAGYGLTTPATQRWSAVLAAMLGMAEDNQGVNSETIATTPGANTVVPAPGYARLGTAWADRTPEVAVLMHGLNDVKHDGNLDPGGGLGYSLERFKARVRQAIWMMQANCPGALIVVAGITWGTTAQWTNLAEFAHGSEAIALAWEDAIGAVCREPTVAADNLLFVPLFRQMKAAAGDSLNQSDGTHPSEDGARFIANQIYRRIAAWRMRPAARLSGVV